YFNFRGGGEEPAHEKPSHQWRFDTAKSYFKDPNTATQDIWDYYNAFNRELHTRFIDNIYPTKFFLAYTSPILELTVGDFYAQLGRGLVFSSRKLDEVATDTTVRGGKVQIKKGSDAGSVSAT